MDWATLNTRYVMPARRHLTAGRAAQGEELLRRGLEETGDPWLAFQLGEAIVWLSPEEAPRLKEAAAFYRDALNRLQAELHRRLAEVALAKAEALLAMAPRREAVPRTLLPSADAPPVPRRRPPPPPEPAEEPPPPDPLLEKLRTEFGHESFRPAQREVLEALLQQKRAIAIMPPGSGGTLLCELSAKLLEGGATIIVTPGADGAEAEAVREGRSRIARVGPQDVGALEGLPIALLIIEEAHRVSDWSHEYQADYGRLREAIQRGAPGTVLAVTPVATPRVRADIADKLGLAAPAVHAAPHDRRHLVWSVIETNDKAEALKLALAEQPGPAIVLAQRRSDVDVIVQQLKTLGIAAEPHHAGMDEAAREAAIEGWQSDRARVLVSIGLPATRKRNVRAVIHWQMPSSLEAYYLEALAAGRDGETAQCVLLYAPDDKASHATAIERAHPDRAAVLAVLEALSEHRDPGEGATVEAALRALEEQSFIRRAGADFEPSPDAPELKRLDTLEIERRRRQAEERLREMARYAEARGCRRMEMLSYFGERLPAGWQCAGCDRCRTAREGASPDAGVMRQAVVMGVRDLEGRRFSITEMARAILFLAPPHVTRALKGKSEKEVRDLINALLREGAIELDPRGQFVRSRR